MGTVPTPRSAQDVRLLVCGRKPEPCLGPIAKPECLLSDAIPDLRRRFCVGVTCGTSYFRNLISVGVSWHDRPLLF